MRTVCTSCASRLTKAVRAMVVVTARAETCTSRASLINISNSSSTWARSRWRCNPTLRACTRLGSSHRSVSQARWAASASQPSSTVILTSSALTTLLVAVRTSSISKLLLSSRCSSTARASQAWHRCTWRLRCSSPAACSRCSSRWSRPCPRRRS